MTTPAQSELPKHFTWHGPTQKAACINYLKNYQGVKIKVDITEHISDQTDSQRGYFHLGCKILGDEIGMTQEEVKLAVKEKLWGSEEIKIADTTIRRYKSMAKGQTNKLDYSDAIETLLQMASFCNVYLPEAGQV